MIESSSIPTTTLSAINGRLHRLQGKRDDLTTRQCEVKQELANANEYLGLGDAVTNALEQLSNDIFQSDLRKIESTMTNALQAVLDQPIVFQANASFSNGAAKVEFSILRGGNQEDIMRGQGGSVANVVSVGLRMFAIAMLDERRHRKFLVLDEQDCWLHPSLVPRLVRVIRKTGKELGFQVLMISHHDVANFVRYADRVYRLTPDRGNGVAIQRIESDEDVMTGDE